MRLSLILPTYNEAENLPELLRRVHAAVQPHEVIVVDDDSPDHTWEIGERLKSDYPHLKIIRRIGVKGLSSAVTDGCDAATGDVLGVMDSDLQHDPAIIASLAKKVEDGADVAVASRYTKGGGVGEWVAARRLLSTFGTLAVQSLLKVKSTDPMSGFFAMSAETYRRARPMLVPEGFKILLEILAALPKGTVIGEVPFVFQPRLHGKSKLSFAVLLQFLKQVARIALRRVGITGPRAFIAVAVVLAVALFVRAWPLRSLYMDSSLRTAVSKQLRDVATSKGWQLSDLSIIAIGDDGSLTIERREHRRGSDPRECWFLPSTGELVPCAN